MKRFALLAIWLSVVLGSGTALAQSDIYRADDLQQGLNFSTPETTWSHFKEAMIEGNFDLALECCCPENNRFLDKYKRFGKVKASRAFRSVKSFVRVRQDENTAQFRITRDINGTNFSTYVSFAKVDNQWKIKKY